MLVRPAELPDATRVREVYLASWRAGYAGLLAPEVLEVEAGTRRARDWADEIGRPADHVAVAVDGDDLVGVVQAAPPPGGRQDLPVIEMLYVVPDAWGTGAASALLDDGVAWMRRQGWREARLRVVDAQARARRFYEREGWRQDRELPPAHNGFFDLVHYRRTLTTGRDERPTGRSDRGRASRVEPDHVAEARRAYDALAHQYARRVGTEVSSVVETSFDRAALGTFVDRCTADGVALPVADVGCGPGRVAALLAAHGLDVVGVDVSTTMLAVARAAHPHVRFAEGRLTDLPVADHGLAGAVCWYSVIHTPPGGLAAVWAELARALAPGAPLLVAFQAGGGERVHSTGAYGTDASLTSYRHAPDDVGAGLMATGFHAVVPTIRAPVLAHESTPQAFVLARAPA